MTDGIVSKRQDDKSEETSGSFALNFLVLFVEARMSQMGLADISELITVWVITNPNVFDSGAQNKFIFPMIFLRRAMLWTGTRSIGLQRCVLDKYSALEKRLCFFSPLNREFSVKMALK